jgi:tetratricopeptide (TPR) repeat protein
MNGPPPRRAQGGRSRLTAILIVGGALVAVALHRGSALLGPLPREDDPALHAIVPLADEVAESRLARSLELERTGDLEGAAREAAAAFDLAGDRDAALQAAKVAILQERWDDAETWLRPLLTINPADGAASYNLALVAHHRGRVDAARTAYEAALDAEPGNAAARYNLALLESDAGRYEQARAHASRFRRDFPEDPRGPTLLQIVERPR